MTSLLRAFLIACAFVACGGPPQGAPHGTPQSTTRADCVEPVEAATCNPSTWWTEALGRLEPAAKAACDSFTQVLVVAGSGAATESELVDFKKRVTDQLRAIEGLRMHAVGLCCKTTPDDRCLSLFLEPCGTPVDEIVGKIAELARQDAQMTGREIRLRVQFIHSRPWCQGPADGSSRRSALASAG